MLESASATHAQISGIRRHWPRDDQQWDGFLLAGDIVGALLNRTNNTISFIKNGIDLGVAFRNVYQDRLYPSIGLRTPDEEVTITLLCSYY